MGSADRQLPDGYMKGKKSQIPTSIGAVVRHENGKVWHKSKKATSWGLCFPALNCSALG